MFAGKRLYSVTASAAVMMMLGMAAKADSLMVKTQGGKVHGKLIHERYEFWLKAEIP